MADEEIQRKKGIEPSQQGTIQEVPDSLLIGVLGRLARRDEYVASHESMQELVQALSHPQWEVRAAAVRALGDFGEQASIDSLLMALQDEHRLVRAAAVRALGCLGARVPLEQLIIALQDREWEVREMVVLTLGELGRQTPRALLAAALQDSNTRVQEAAIYALSQYDATSITQKEEQDQSLKHVNLTQGWSPAHLAAHLWLVFSRQVALIHKSVWLFPILGMFIWCAFSLLSPMGIQNVALTLALFASISAAAGAAFIYSKEYDPGFEITLSTPTSIRVVMLSRFLLVISFNVLLASCASAALVLLHGGSFWSILHVWLGPMLLTASIAVMLSLMIGSWFATLASSILEASQAFTFTMQHNMPVVVMVYANTWQTNLPMLLGALLFVVCAVLYVARQPRFMQF